MVEIERQAATAMWRRRCKNLGQVLCFFAAYHCQGMRIDLNLLQALS